MLGFAPFAGTPFADSGQAPGTATAYTQAWSPTFGFSPGTSTLTYTLNGTLGVNVTITPDIGGALYGSLSPTSVTIDAGSTVGTTTLTTAFDGAVTVNSTNNQGLTNPAAALYLSGPTTIIPGTISLVAATNTTLDVSATEASGGHSPYTHQWYSRLSGVGDYIADAGATTLALLLTTLTPNTAYDLALAYTGTNGQQATTFATFSTTAGGGNDLVIASVPGTYPSYVINTTKPIGSGL